MTDLELTGRPIGASPERISYTCKLKVYPSGSVAVTAADRPIFRRAGWEERHKRVPLSPFDDWTADEAGQEVGPTRDEWEAAKVKERANVRRSRQRAITAVRDYALCNDFGYFVTLTLDQTKIDRYDLAEIVRAMRVWCDNQVRRHGLRYVLVPELHKDGAVHFHGFFPDGVEVVDSGTIIPPGGGKPRKPRSKRQRSEWLEGGGHIVYNLPDWGYGYSTAIELYGNYHAAVAYVCKYISKAEGKLGGRWYYSGGKLKKPEVQFTDATIEDVLRDSTDEETGAVRARVYEVPAVGLRLCYDFVEVGIDYYGSAARRNRARACEGSPKRERPSGQVGACEPEAGDLEAPPGCAGGEWEQCFLGEYPQGGDGC